MAKGVIVAILVVFMALYFGRAQKAMFLGAEGVYTLSVENESSSAKFISFNAKDTDNIAKYKMVTGQSVYGISKDYIDEFLTKYQCVLVFSEATAYGETNYYYSPKIWGYKSINGKKVNVQTAICSYGNTIGTPIIYGGY